MQDGYTLETLDIHTIEDGVEKVIIHNVRTSSDNLSTIHLITTGTFEGICWCPDQSVWIRINEPPMSSAMLVVLTTPLSVSGLQALVSSPVDEPHNSRLGALRCSGRPDLEIGRSIGEKQGAHFARRE